MKQLFDSSSFQCSKAITKAYSTSFSMGIRLFAPRIRSAVYAIYGFVRSADEIVDTFQKYDQETLFNEFVTEYDKALARRISLNPILNAFQKVAHQYNLQHLVDIFLESMKMDLNKREYRTQHEYKKYILGSADVVGLMCLKVFVNGDKQKYEQLRIYAARLGTALQKVNFLRDVKDDFQKLGRSYFPNVKGLELNNELKDAIVKEIEADFKEAYKGIIALPMGSKLGVYLAYRYYLLLLKKLKYKDSMQIMESRIRVSNTSKAVILMKSYMRYKLNLI